MVGVCCLLAIYLYLRKRFFLFYCSRFYSMKKVFNILLLLVAVVSMAVSCGPGEAYSTFEYYYDGIYTVNKHAVRPEFMDTNIMVSNMDAQELATGDRARLWLHHYYDSRVTAKPVMEIFKVVEVIPTLALTAAENVNTEEFASPLLGLATLDNEQIFGIEDKAAWIWDNRQNINVYFKGDKRTSEFAMAVRGVVGDSIEFDLYAKTDGDENATPVSRLLAFDLSDIGNYITAEQQNALAAKEKLWTRIYCKREVKDGDVTTVREVNFLGGTFDNPFKK